MSYPFFRTNLCNGSYLELGAHDGSKYSNTYVFHKALHWNGILIELTPSKYQKLGEKSTPRYHRPRGRLQFPTIGPLC
jgi:hypothetical protein